MKKGIWRFFVSTNHRDIGSSYLGFAIFAGLLGAVFSLILRLGLNEAGIAYFHNLSTLLYGEGNSKQLLALMSTGHALIMIFFMVIPALIGGFANWMVPLLIGTDDTAFPRMNRLAFWLLVVAFLLFILPLLCLATANTTRLIEIAALHMCGLSLLLSFINFIATIVTMRAPGMGFGKMPLFVWSVLIASFLGLMCVPVMLAASILPGFFDHQQAANLPIMLWFLTHPENYVLLLPAFGLISQIVTTFSRRRLFAESGVVSAMIVIGVMGFIIWTQSLFQGANTSAMTRYFEMALPLIGLPTAFILASWMVTLLSGKMRLHSPLLWALGFVFISLFGVISAFQLVLNPPHNGDGIVPAFIAHFHYIIALSAVFAIFCGWYFWFPKMSGLMIRDMTAKLHFWLLFIAINMIFLPQHLSGYGKENGSLFAKFDALVSWNTVSSIGALLAALSLIVFISAMVETLWRKVPAPNNPWGDDTKSLEWMLPSPPPQHVWRKVPRIS